MRPIVYVYEKTKLSFLNSIYIKILKLRANLKNNPYYYLLKFSIALNIFLMLFLTILIAVN